MSNSKKSKISSYIPKYIPGQRLYAISFHNDSSTKYVHEEKIDDWSMDFARIHKVYVESISIGQDGISYWLKDAINGEDYGDSVYEEFVSDTLSNLLEILTKRWKL